MVVHSRDSAAALTAVFGSVQVYGGFVATLLLSSEVSEMKCGAAVSPITDFNLYGRVHSGPNYSHAVMDTSPI